MDRYSSNKKPIQEDNAPTAGFIELCMNALKHNNLPYVQELATSASFVLSSKLFGNKAMAIHVAAEHGSLNVLAYLLQQFPGQLDETDEFGKTPVFCAAAHGQLRVVKYLIQQGAKLDTVVNDPSLTYPGSTAIITAMASNYHSVVVALFNARGLTSKVLEQRRFYLISLKWAIEQNHTIILDCLLSVGKFSSLDMNFQVELMSIAAQVSSPEVIQLLAQQNVDVLQQPNHHGVTPLYWACCRGEIDFLNILIENGVNIDQPCTQQGNRFFDKPMYLVAHARKHYAVASKIIHTIFNLDVEKTVFDFIDSGDDAIEYCLLSSVNARLILKNPDILKLIKRAGGRCAAESIGFYKTVSTRRPSFFADININTGESEFYTELRALGAGSNSSVREFSDQTHQKSIAVKTPREKWFVTNNFSDEIEVATREMHFMKRAYGLRDIKECQYFTLRRLSYTGKNEYTLRKIMRYVGENTVEKVLQYPHPPEATANVILIMTKALMSLHEKGIIHGDVKENNAVISQVNDQLLINFVDFEYAYDLTESVATIAPTGDYWAPERRVADNGPVPHANQDAYSFAVMLQRIINHHPNAQDLIRLFPSIRDFSRRGANEDPSRRSTLESFASRLSTELTTFCIDLEEPLTFSEVEEAAYHSINF